MLALTAWRLQNNFVRKRLINAFSNQVESAKCRVESVVPVLVGRPDGGERQLQLKLPSAVDEVALLQLREQHKLAAPVRCR